jgi:acetolactate synthase I/II/III large subunit
MKASDLLVRALENEGARYVLGVPGEENLDFVESLRTSSIELIPTRHEQTAGFMAATIGRLTGHPGVALSTLGPGATNFTTAAAYAQLGGMPMMMITGQKPIKTSKQGHFQIVDIVQMMKPITKYAKQISNANILAASVREAFRLSQEERPGAVHLELPEDIAAEETTYDQVFPVARPRRPVAEEKAIKKAVAMIESAQHPLLLIGAAANRKLTSKMLRECIDKTGIPFFNTQMGKGVVSERHPLFVGTAALSSNDILHRIVEKADLIINVGHDVIEKPPFIMKRENGQVIHINFQGAQVDNVYFPQHEVIGDIANAIWQIKEAIQKQLHWDFSCFKTVKKAIDDHIARDVDVAAFPIVPQRIVADVRRAMPDDGIIALDNGMYKIWFARNYRAYQPNTILLDNALATMGAGLSSAMAARLVYPERKIAAIVGDGGFMMNSQELETAVRLKMNLVVLILNDSGYGMIKWKQQGMGFADHGLDFTNPDFVQYAASYGAHGHRLAQTEAFLPLLKECLDAPGVHVIDVPIDYAPNQTVLNKELPEIGRTLAS